MELKLPAPPPLVRCTISDSQKPTTTQVILHFQNTRIPAVLTPIECENNHVFRLELCRSIFDQVLHRVLDCLPWLNLCLGWLPPVWLLPATLIFKRAMPEWEQEFRHECMEYGQLSRWQGRPFPIYFSVTAYCEVGSDVRTVGMLLTYYITSLEERQELREGRLLVMHREALNLLVASGRVHTDLRLSNILFDGRDLRIVNLEQTSTDLNEFDVEAEALNLLRKYRFRQEQIRNSSV